MKAVRDRKKEKEMTYQKTRLINAETLKVEIGKYEDYMLNRLDIIGEIDDEPTVDAIPVEFIQKKENEFQKNGEDKLLTTPLIKAAALEELIISWKEENGTDKKG